MQCKQLGVFLDLRTQNMSNCRNRITYTVPFIILAEMCLSDECRLSSAQNFLNSGSLSVAVAINASTALKIANALAALVDPLVS